TINNGKENKVTKKQKSEVMSSNRNWEVLEEKAKKVQVISIDEVHQLKYGNLKQYDKGDDYHISAFVVMSVG
ncbi:15371_t:CDS:2, partial [Gigaspora margarita]